MKSPDNFLKATLLFWIAFSQVSHAQLIKYDNWEVAQKEAITTKKKVLIILTGSEWCRPCIKMKKRVIETPEFEKFASENLVVFELNLKRHLDMNSKLVKDYLYFKEKYQTNALPTLVLVEPDGMALIKFSDDLFSPASVITRLLSKM